jgi:hypothetical protein
MTRSRFAGVPKVAGTNCLTQSPDSPADAASSQALLTWIWQLAHRQTETTERKAAPARRRAMGT